MLKGKTEKTKRTVDIELSTKYLVPTEVPEEIEAYYDSRERTYVIKTRSAGVVRMKPPTKAAGQTQLPKIMDIKVLKPRLFYPSECASMAARLSWAGRKLISKTSPAP